MTTGNASADSARACPAAPVIVSAALPSWPRRRAVFLLAGAAQLITISALVGADPIPATWSSLLPLAPTPFAAAAVLLPFRFSRPNTKALVVVVIAAIGTAVWFDFLFTLPYQRFTVRSSAEVTTFVVLPVVGVIVSQLAAYARRLRVVAITDERYLAQIDQAAALAQTATSPEVVVEHVCQQLIGLLDLRADRCEHARPLGQPPRLQADGAVVTGRGRWDVDKDGLPGEEIELRVFGNGQYCGRFMLTPKPGSRPSLQARLVAVALAEQAGRALAAGAPLASTGQNQAERCLV